MTLIKHIGNLGFGLVIVIGLVGVLASLTLAQQGIDISPSVTGLEDQAALP